MIKTDVHKHDTIKELDKYIERKIRDGYELVSCSTKDIFWTFSLYSKESTLVWRI